MRRSLNLLGALLILGTLWHVFKARPDTFNWQEASTSQVPSSEPLHGEAALLEYHLTDAQQPQSSMRFSWADLPEHYPVKTYLKAPSDPGRKSIPKVQATKFTIKNAAERQLQAERLAAVKANFTHAWNGYKTHAWLKDEVSPLSGGSHDPFGGWGATLVDALGMLFPEVLTFDYSYPYEIIQGRFG